MKVHGSINPGRFSVELVPGTNRSLVRLFQNVTPCQRNDFDGFEYDEYHVEVETWDGVAQNVQDNFDVFLKQGMENEINRSNEALFEAQQQTNSAVQDMDAASVDLDYRLTLLELGVS